MRFVTDVLKLLSINSAAKSFVNFWSDPFELVDPKRKSCEGLQE